MSELPTLNTDPTSPESGELRPSVGSSPQTIPPEILDKMPPQMRSIVEFSMMQAGPTQSPLLQHVNAAHIDRALENAEKSDARQADAYKEDVRDRQHSRTITWIGIGLGIIILGVLWFSIPIEKLASLKEIITTLISLGAVGFGGYGFALSKSREKD